MTGRPGTKAVLVAGVAAIAAGVAGLVWSIRGERERERAVEASAIPLECSHVHPPAQSACPAADARVKEIVAAANQISVGPGHCSVVGDRPALERRIAPAVDALAAVALAELTARERVIAQNAVVRIASCLLDGGRAPPTSVEIAATRQLRRLALPAAVLDDLGVEPREAEAWLGARATWTEREPIVTPMQHEGGYGYSRVFSPVFYGPSAALFSQLVAVDDAGNPRITAIVGEIEARTPALGAPDRACVVKLDPTRARCDAGALAVTALDALPPSSFVFSAGSGVGCKSCHADGPFLTRDSREGSTTSAQRRASLLARLAERLETLKRREAAGEAR